MAPRLCGAPGVPARLWNLQGTFLKGCFLGLTEYAERKKEKLRKENDRMRNKLTKPGKRNLHFVLTNVMEIKSAFSLDGITASSSANPIKQPTAGVHPHTDRFMSVSLVFLIIWNPLQKYQTLNLNSFVNSCFHIQ